MSLACVLVAVLRRYPAWDPASLWLDDEWLALAVRNSSLSDLFALQLPAPAGFLMLQKLTSAVSLDPETTFQIVPMAAGLLAIPMFYGLLRRVVRHPVVRAIACLGAACHATAELYAVRAKHYTLDLLLSIALLSITVALLQQPRTQRMLQLALSAIAAVFFSFASLFISACTIHALALDQLLRARNEPKTSARAYVVCALGFDLAVVAVYFGYLREQSSDVMRAFWHKYFLAFDNIGSFAYHGLGGFALRVMSPPLIALLVFVVVGMRIAGRDRTLRPLTWATYALLLGLISAAALQLYPLGPERMDLFAFPLFWLFAAIGCEHALASLRGKGWVQTASAVVLAVYVLGSSLLRPPVSYSDARDRQVVEAAVSRYQPGDALLTHAFGVIALSYYGRRRVQLSPSEQVTHRFAAHPDWPDLYVIPFARAGTDFRSDPGSADETLTELTEHGPRRILYLTTHATGSVDARVSSTLTSHGYAVRSRLDASPGASLVLFGR